MARATYWYTKSQRRSTTKALARQLMHSEKLQLHITKQHLFFRRRKQSSIVMIGHGRGVSLQNHVLFSSVSLTEWPFIMTNVTSVFCRRGRHLRLGQSLCGVRSSLDVRVFRILAAERLVPRDDDASRCYAGRRRD